MNVTMKRGPPFHLISQCPNLVSRGHTCYQVLGYLSGNFDLYKSTYDCIAPRFKYTHTHTHTHTHECRTHYFVLGFSTHSISHSSPASYDLWNQPLVQSMEWSFIGSFPPLMLHKGFPSGAVVKNPPANAGDARDRGSIPGCGRSPGGGKDNPFQYSCLENSVDRGAWWATAHGVPKSPTWLSMQAT